MNSISLFPVHSITITHVEINEIKSTLSVYGWMKFVSIASLVYDRSVVESFFFNEDRINTPNYVKGIIVKIIETKRKPKSPNKECVSYYIFAALF